MFLKVFSCPVRSLDYILCEIACCVGYLLIFRMRTSGHFDRLYRSVFVEFFYFVYSIAREKIRLITDILAADLWGQM